MAINGRGVGYAGVAGTTSAGAYGAVLKDDLFNPGVLLGGGFAGAGARAGRGRERRRPHRLPAGRRQRRALGHRASLRLRARVAARHAARAPARRSPTRRSGRRTPSRGLEAAADRAGDVAIAFVQGDGDGRQIVAASLDRAPGSFRASTSTKWRKFARPPLKWGTAFELWGPLTYQRADRQQAGRADDLDRRDRAGRGAPTGCTAGASSPPTSAARARRRPRATCASTPRRRRSPTRSRARASAASR